MPETRKGTATFGKISPVIRSFTVTIGELYRVVPLDPQAAKHRGRLCVVLRFLNEERVRVRFLADRKNATLPIGDLVAAGHSMTDNTEARAQDALVLVRNTLRKQLTGPYKNDLRVDELLDKFIQTPPGEVDSPDRPDYLMEAQLHAEGLFHASDAAQLIGEVELELNGVVDNLIQNITQRIEHDRPQSETGVRDIVQAAVDESKQEVALIDVQLRRRYGLQD